MQVYRFWDLLCLFYSMILALAATETGPRRKAGFEATALNILSCKGFSELVTVLERAPNDRKLRKMTAKMSESNGKRRWLNGRVEEQLRDWYAQYADNPEVTTNIARMADEVGEAYWAYVNFGVEVPTRNWHDNQCGIYCDLLDERDYELAKQARKEGKEALYAEAAKLRKQQIAEMRV